MEKIYFRNEKSKARFERDNPNALSGLTAIVGAPRFPHDNLNGVFIGKGLEALNRYLDLTKTLSPI